MAAGSRTLKRFVPGDQNSPARRWPLLASAAIGMLACLALTLAVRRLAGALVQPLSSTILLTCALAVLAAASALHRLILGLPASDRSKSMLQAAVVLLLCVVAWCLSLPGSNRPAVALVWMSAVLPALVIQAPWRRFGHALRPRARQIDSPPHRDDAAELSTSTHGPEVDRFMEFSAAGETWPEESIDDESLALDPRIQQQVTRLRVDNGQESVTGWCRVALAAQQRQAASHLAFCPPLSHSPVIEFEQLDGPQARIKAGQTLAHGVRVDLKLVDAPTETCEVVFRFTARASAPAAPLG